jgi:hypothetical protein
MILILSTLNLKNLSTNCIFLIINLIDWFVLSFEWTLLIINEVNRRWIFLYCKLIWCDSSFASSWIICILLISIKLDAIWLWRILISFIRFNTISSSYVWFISLKLWSFVWHFWFFVRAFEIEKWFRYLWDDENYFN